jgi:hypothetical protein
MRAEHEGSCRAMRRERVDKQSRGFGGVSAICHPRLFRQRHRYEPVEQRSPHRADDAHLRKMDVRIDESGNDEPSAPINSLSAWMRIANGRVLSADDDTAVVDEKPAVLMTCECRRIADVERKRILGGMKDRGAEQLHYLNAGRRT